MDSDKMKTPSHTSAESRTELDLVYEELHKAQERIAELEGQVAACEEWIEECFKKRTIELENRSKPPGKSYGR